MALVTVVMNGLLLLLLSQVGFHSLSFEQKIEQDDAWARPSE